MKPTLPSILRKLLVAGMMACAVGPVAATNVVERLSSNPDFSTLVTAVKEAGLVEALAEAESVTIFAPSNAAFAKIPANDLSALLADKAALTRVLTYHVAGGETRFRDFSSGELPVFLEGESVEIDVKRYFRGLFRVVRVDGVRISHPNISASNGVIHRIEEVLDPGFAPLPSILDIAGGEDFSILAGLVGQAGLAKALGSDYYNLTVFAPTNAAFEALAPETLAAVQADAGLLRRVLLNHIALGAKDSAALGEAGEVKTALGVTLEVGPNAESLTGLGIDGKPIDAADIKASNGIVHVVGQVLVPPTPKSLVDVASGREDLSTFTSVLGLAGLADLFDTTRKWPAYTIFAPDNAAFAAVPQENLDRLLADPTGALADVLKLHVVSGRLEADHLFDGQTLTTLAGERLKVSIGEDGVRINNALVKKTNLRAENGVLHIVGDVIAPDAFTVADFVGSKSYLSTLNAALGAANLTGSLDDPDSEVTLFAPINYAFDRLPEGTVATLLADPSGDLTQILLYHVAGGSQSSSELIDAETVATLQGSTVEVSSYTFRFWGWRVPYSIVKVNGNRVVAADIKTDNGTVHLISGVLLPPASE